MGRMRTAALLALSMLMGTAYAQEQVQEADDSECIQINRILLKGVPAELSWVQNGVVGLKGQCLSEQNVMAALRATTNELAAAGYVTSRFYIPEQDAGNGTLIMQFVAGTVGDIRVTGAALDATNVLELQTGDILNSRELDQATDHLRRLTSLDAKVLIEPAEEPGVSDLVISLTPVSQPIHGTVSVSQEDIAANRVQVGDLPPRLQQVAELPIQTKVNFDNLTQHADLLSVDGTLSPSLILGQGGTASVSARYSVPKGASLFGVGASYTNNHSLQPGYETTLDYNGQSANFYTDINHVLDREAQTQLAVSQRFNVALSRSAINDVEIKVQRKNMYRSETEVTYSRNTPENQSTFGLKHVLTFNDFLNLPETSGWSSRIEPSYGVTKKFQLNDKNLTYQGTIGGQLSIVGAEYQPYVLDKSVVRGLPSIASASGPHAVTMQNKVTYLAQDNFNPYVTFDAARLFGAPSDQINSAVSTTVGVNGTFSQTRYDVNAGFPLQSPGEGQRELTFGAQLSWKF